jgi:uncharacterized protein YjbI with pentapeptide repeats
MPRHRRGARSRRRTASGRRGQPQLERLRDDFRPLDFRALDFRALDFRGLDFRGLDFRGLDFRALERLLDMRFAVDFRPLDARLLDERLLDARFVLRLRDGTLSPSLRASESPIAIACLRLVTLPP